MNANGTTSLAQSQDIEKYLALQGSPNERITAILSKIESETRKAALTVLDMKPDASSTALVGEGIYRVQLHCEGCEEDIQFYL